MILTKVTGTTFKGRQEIIRGLQVNGQLEKDTIIRLERDPACFFDENAQKCVVDGQVIGYLDRECAEIITAMADRGVQYVGIVDWIGFFKEQIGIRILLKRID